MRAQHGDQDVQALCLNLVTNPARPRDGILPGRATAKDDQRRVGWRQQQPSPAGYDSCVAIRRTHGT